MTAQKKIDQASPIRYYLKTQTVAMWLINYFARSINRAVNTAAPHCTTQLLVVHVSSEPWENICYHFLLTNNSAMPGSEIDLSENELPAPIGKRKATDKSSVRKIFATTATSAPSKRVFLPSWITDGPISKQNWWWNARIFDFSSNKCSLFGRFLQPS